MRVFGIVLLIGGIICGVLAFRMSRASDFRVNGGSRQSSRFLEDGLRSAYGSQADGFVSQLRTKREHRESTQGLLIVGAVVAVCFGLCLFMLSSVSSGGGTLTSPGDSESSRNATVSDRRDEP